MQSVQEIEGSVYAHFKFSFGAWSILSLFLEPVDFMRLQALSNYCYRTSISRAQVSFAVSVEDLTAFLVRNKLFEKSVLMKAPNGWTKLFNPCYDISSRYAVSLVVG